MLRRPDTCGNDIERGRRQYADWYFCRSDIPGGTARRPGIRGKEAYKSEIVNVRLYCKRLCDMIKKELVRRDGVLMMDELRLEYVEKISGRRVLDYDTARSCCKV